MCWFKQLTLLYNFELYFYFQIREWQHWGSGCYKYKCESGRLHIVVSNTIRNHFTSSYRMYIGLLSDLFEQPLDLDLTLNKSPFVPNESHPNASHCDSLSENIQMKNIIYILI